MNDAVLHVSQGYNVHMSDIFCYNDMRKIGFVIE